MAKKKGIDNLWQRINALVPNPNCGTCNGHITKWDDDRSQPAEEELLAVDVSSLQAPVDPLLQEFDDAKTIANLKTVLRKVLFPTA